MTDNLLLTAVQAGPAPGGATQILLGLAPWLAVFAIFWFMVIRPQQRRVAEHKAQIAAVQKGDEVITGGGIRGRVTRVMDDEAEVEIAPNVRIRVVKSTLTAVLGKSAPAND